MSRLFAAFQSPASPSAPWLFLAAQRAQQPEQLHRIARLDQVVIEAHLARDQLIAAFLPDARHGDQQWPADVSESEAHRLSKRVPADARHRDVEHHRIGAEDAQDVQHFVPVVRLVDEVAFGFEEGRERKDSIAVVVDYKDPQGRGVSPSVGTRFLLDGLYRHVFRAARTNPGSGTAPALSRSMQPAKCADILKAAAETLGGDAHLATFLGVPVQELRLWLTGERVPSLPAFLEALDLVSDGPYGPRKRRIRVAVIRDPDSAN